MSGRAEGRALRQARADAEAARQIAETLQHNLLPDLAEVPGLAIARRYHTATRGVDIGGDWYDVLPLPDDRVGVTIGDVMGHDMRAAAGMGQLHVLLRAFAWEGSSPAEALDRADDLVRGLRITPLATAVYATIESDPADTAHSRLRYASAGHLPPIMRRADGSAELLDEGQSVVLGAGNVEERAEATTAFRQGDTLLLYTDGLVEERGADIDDRIALLMKAVAEAPLDTTPDQLCDLVLDALHVDELTDDIALLAVKKESTDYGTG